MYDVKKGNNNAAIRSRITSYNVCYTKLLRHTGGHLPDRNAGEEENLGSGLIAPRPQLRRLDGNRIEPSRQGHIVVSYNFV